MSRRIGHRDQSVALALDHSVGAEERRALIFDQVGMLSRRGLLLQRSLMEHYGIEIPCFTWKNDGAEMRKVAPAAAKNARRWRCARR